MTLNVTFVNPVAITLNYAPFQNGNSPISNPIIKMGVTNASRLSEVTKKCEPSEPTPYFNLAMTKKRS